MKTQENSFFVCLEDGVVCSVSNSVILQPAIAFAGGKINWYEDRQKYHFNMTFDEYNKKMSEYADKLSVLSGKEWESLYEDISKFQQAYMENILENYEKTIDCEAKRHIYDLMCYAVRISESGSSIVDVETKEIADEIESIIWEEIGDYLLDYQVYKEDNHWVVDCIFAGYYVP